MNTAEALMITRRIIGIWPAPALDKEAKAEWIDFLIELEYEPAISALVSLRESQRYRPSMSELKSAYLSVCSGMQEIRQQTEVHRLLPGRKSATADNEREPYGNLDWYGSSVKDWVYCWRCNMAIRLEERDTTAVHAPGLGLRHDRCPLRGTAPLMPVEAMNEREAYWQRKGIKLPERMTA